MATTMALGHGIQVAERKRTRKVSALLWTVQGLLAATFFMTGLMKLTTPMDAILASMPIALPAFFVRFLGAAELLGAIGLVLPCLLRIHAGLTSLAAGCLAFIMAGATVYTLLGGGGATAIMPLLLGVLAGFVAYGRSR
jgi:uncharacterized membrane protein YphA (DoxX/SURF4 family)